MNTKLEKKFEKIAETAIREAELVDCDGKDFVKGLDIIVSEVQQRLQLAADEFKGDL